MKRFALQDKRKRNYFEGWYVRILDQAQGLNVALIFAKTHFHKDPHAFLQIFDAVAGTNRYLRFPLASFSFEDGCVRIGEQTLSPEHIHVSEADVSVTLTISNPVELGKKSAMGPLLALPLECYQEVIYMAARVAGSVRLGTKTITIENGQSYMEKTYGRRFPKRWFWLQANRFDEQVAISLAGGKVPTLLFKKFGYFFILHLPQKTLVLATYNFARLKFSEQADGTIWFSLKKGRYKIHMVARQIHPVVLVGPQKHGEMTLDVPESLESTVHLEVYDRHKLIYEGFSEAAGFEWMYKKTDQRSKT